MVSRIQPFIIGYSPEVWVSSDMRFAYRGLRASRSSSSSARRTIRAERRKPYRLVRSLVARKRCALTSEVQSRISLVLATALSPSPAGFLPGENYAWAAGFLDNVVIYDNMNYVRSVNWRTANDPKDTTRFMDQGGTEGIRDVSGRG